MASRRPASAILLALVLLAGCRDSPQGVKPEEWARQVCAGLLARNERREARVRALQEEVTSDRSLVDRRQRLVTLIDDGLRSTEELLAGLDRLGKPAVEGGEQIHRQVRDNFEELRHSFADAKAQAEVAPVDNLVALQSRVEAIGGELDAAEQRAGRNLVDVDDQHRSPELDRAFEREPVCDRLRRGPGP